MQTRKPSKPLAKPQQRSQKPKTASRFVDNDQMVCGIHAVKATLEHMPRRAIKLHVIEKTPRLDELVLLAKQMAVVVESLSKAAFVERFGDDVVHQGAVLVTRVFPYVDLHEALVHPPKVCLVLDGIEDPRNLGRAARAAFALGAELLIIGQDRAAQITATVEKAAVGTLAKLPVARVVNISRAIDDLKKAGLWVVGAAGEATLPVWDCDLTKPLALVIGNEEKGIRPLVKDTCDELVSIPMTSSDISLNAADAVTVLMYESARQRNSK